MAGVSFKFTLLNLTLSSRVQFNYKFEAHNEQRRLIFRHQNDSVRKITPTQARPMPTITCRVTNQLKIIPPEYRYLSLNVKSILFYAKLKFLGA